MYSWGCRKYNKPYVENVYLSPHLPKTIYIRKSLKQRNIVSETVEINANSQHEFGEVKVVNLVKDLHFGIVLHHTLPHNLKFVQHSYTAFNFLTQFTLMEIAPNSKILFGMHKKTSISFLRYFN